MFVDSSGGCGIGYLMGTLSSGFESSAFNVVDWDCATGYYSFAHELGHNMGCHHAIPEASQGSALMPYSHGWRWTSAQGTQYRSVMAYSPGSRVNHFSNPDVQHQGEFTGQTIGASDQASNAASINYAASTVAGWRQAVDAISTVPSNSFDSSGMPGGPFAPDSATYTLVNGGSSPLSWTASASDTWFALSSNGGTLAAGETVELVVALNGTANAFTSGNYSGSVTVTDTANAVSTTRYVNLTVLSPVQYQFTLDTDPGWSTSGAWAFGTPLGQGSHNRDPASGYTGDNVYGYNLAGDYTNDMAETSLTTSAFDFSTLTNTSIGFWRWLGLESSNYDHAAFQISTNGTTWIDLWTHGSGSFSDTAWSYHNYDISQYADNAPAVQFRWVMGETDISVTYPGWNIDDVVVRGTGTSSGLSEAWVDFQQASGGDGSADNPFNTVSDAVDALVDDGSGIIRFMGNPPTVSTAETLTITKPMTMQASSGTVRIGDTP